MFKKVISLVVMLIILTANHIVIAQSSLNDFNGAWLGTMQITDGPKLRVGMEIFKMADGNWGGNIASLDQGQRYKSVLNVKLEKDVSASRDVCES